LKRLSHDRCANQRLSAAQSPVAKAAAVIGFVTAIACVVLFIVVTAGAEYYLG
jgi:hypothetical protein